MNSEYYRVLDGDVVIAEKLTIETALLLIKAMFEHYWQEQDARYVVEKMEEKGENK